MLQQQCQAASTNKGFWLVELGKSPTAISQFPEKHGQMPMEEPLRTDQQVDGQSVNAPVRTKTLVKSAASINPERLRVNAAPVKLPKGALAGHAL